jgi:hypothetical protein
LQLFSSHCHFQPQQILIGRLVIVPPEQLAKIGGIEAAFGGNLLQRP